MMIPSFKCIQALDCEFFSFISAGVNYLVTFIDDFFECTWVYLGTMIIFLLRTQL